MAMTKDQLKKMDKDGLVSLAQSSFGVTLENDVSKDEMIDEILNLFDRKATGDVEPVVYLEEEDELGYEEGPSADDVAAYKASLAAAADQKGLNDKKYRLTIHEQEGPNGRDAVKVSVNGYASVIKRNEEVIVPERVINVLKNAVKTEYEPNDDGKGVVERRVRRFNFQYEAA